MTDLTSIAIGLNVTNPLRSNLIDPTIEVHYGTERAFVGCALNTLLTNCRAEASRL